MLMFLNTSICPDMSWVGNLVTQLRHPPDGKTRWEPMSLYSNPFLYCKLGTWGLCKRYRQNYWDLLSQKIIELWQKHIFSCLSLKVRGGPPRKNGYPCLPILQYGSWSWSTWSFCKILLIPGWFAGPWDNFGQVPFKWLPSLSGEERP